MFETRVTRELGIEYPVVVGTMMHISHPQFVAAASEAGCLGVLASAMFKTEPDFRHAIRSVKTLTEKPFAVNLNLFPAITPVDVQAYLNILIEEGVKIVETSGPRAPEELVPRFKDAGLTWIHKCVGLRYARKAAALGADMVTVVGFENGGATGTLDIGTLVLIHATAKALEIPVIGGGGITSGRGLVAALALGAEAVIMGTAFLLAEECPIHMELKKALLEADETDTMLIMRSVGITHRVWKNARAEQILAMETGNASLEQIIEAASGENDRRMYESGDLEAGTISCGQGIGDIREIKPLRKIVSEMMEEAKETAYGLSRLAAIA